MGSVALPLIIDYLLDSKAPLSIYLLFFIPISIFVFHYSMRKVLLGTLFVSLIHIIWGVIFANNLVTRMYNHLGLTLVLLVCAYLSARFIQELRESEERYRSVVEISPQIIFIHQDEKIVYANSATIKALGLTQESDLINKSIFKFAHPSSKETAISRTEAVYKNNRGEQFIEYKVNRLDGKVSFLELLGTKISYYGNPAIMVVGRDITEKKKTLDQLEEREERYRSLFTNHSDAILTLDLEGNFISANSQTAVVSGYYPEELINKSFIPLIVPEDLESVMISFDKALKGETQNYECRIIHKAGHHVHIDITSIPIKLKDNIVGAYGLVKDVTEQKKMQNKIKHMAYHDTLTGLPNRYLFNEYLKSGITRCEHNNHKLAVMFIDLDRFKQINDTLGHNIGDLLLQQAAKRLKQSVRQVDIVARQGGDEFIILLEDIQREDVQRIAQNILNLFVESFVLDGYEAYTSPSIGISLYPADGKNEVDLIKNADSAMYQAKNQGKNTYSFYNFIQDNNNLNRLTLENNLRKAIQNNELSLKFQPKVELESGNIIGTEALARWDHPEYGLISPSEFIPIAEETGLIIPLGTQVLEKACRQNKKWHEKGFTNLVIAVNISVLQFQKEDLVKTVTNILEKTKLNPNYLLLEITESVLQDVEESRIIINRLKTLGVRVSLDDFGTGYSSLSVLKHLPIHYLKIDKSFIDDIHTNEKNIVKAIIEMGHNLNFKLVAEGIENEEQLSYLKQNGCQYGQGYLFSKPMNAKDIENLLTVTTH